MILLVYKYIHMAELRAHIELTTNMVTEWTGDGLRIFLIFKEFTMTDQQDNKAW